MAKQKVARKRSPKSAAMLFVSIPISLDTTGPSGTSYTFTKGTPTPVTDRLDISSFMQNRDLKVYGSGSADHVDNFQHGQQSSEPVDKIHGLMSEDQLDHMYNSSNI